MTDDGFGLDSGRADVILLHDGRTLTTHGPAACLTSHCCIHNPSDHPLKDAPLTWADDLKMLFRVCEHEHLHPDPDSLDFRIAMSMIGRAPFYDGWHPCCEYRCCTDIQKE